MRVFVIAAMAALAGEGASAQGSLGTSTPLGPFPQIGGEVHLTLTHARNYAGNAGIAINHETFTDSHLNLGLFLSPEWSVQARFNAEPARTLTNSRFLDDTAVFLQEVFVQYERDWFSVFGGKFNPVFSLAPEHSEKLRKPFGFDYVEDYELTEGIGVGASVRHATLQWGTHELTGSVFHFDNTFLGNTLIGARPPVGAADTERPGRLRRLDGGPGNTNTPSSFSVQLEGDQFAIVPNFTYHLAYARLARGATETRTQQMYSVGAQYRIEPVKLLGGPPALRSIYIAPLVEHAWVNQFGGNPGGVELNARYLTTAVEVGYSGFWTYFLRTSRKLREPDEGTGPNGANGFQDRLLVASAGYDFDFGLIVSAGWKRDRTLSVDTDTVGLFVEYHVKF
jgi:hypothetical protein